MEERNSSNQKMHDIGKNLPWVEKYRPVDLDDLIAQDDIISTSLLALFSF